MYIYPLSVISTDIFYWNELNSRVSSSVLNQAEIKLILFSCLALYVSHTPYLRASENRSSCYKTIFYLHHLNRNLNSARLVF